MGKKLTDFKFKGRASLRKSKYFTIELYAYEHMQCYGNNNNNNDKVIRDIMRFCHPHVILTSLPSVIG